ncbi:hypothetical protein FRC17_001353 [Serendipita sp. 399]|nr:hypothetical protein FRC17_001353 [Serendipita sp. 399]
MAAAASTPPSPPARAIYRGSDWPKLSNIRNFFIFGDSYSSVIEEEETLPNPTSSHPLGSSEPFPGDPWTGQGPNWVGHLLLRLTNQSYNNSTSSLFHNSNLRIYDYAKAGDDVNGLAHQVRTKFLGKQARTVRWNAQDSLFVLWIGINDLAEAYHPSRPMKQLFQLVEELHDAGARNVLLIDCPPIHKTPAAHPDFGPDSERYEAWNRLLYAQARLFVQRHQDHIRTPSTSSASSATSSASSSFNPSSFANATNTSSYFSAKPPPSSPHSAGPSPLSTPNQVGVQGDTSMFVFSAWNTFMSVLDYPEAYDFDAEDVDEAEGPVWYATPLPPSPLPPLPPLI